MSETEQLYLPLQTESSHTDNGFYDSLNFIRENANSQYGVGKVFERLIKSYLLEVFFNHNGFLDVNASFLKWIYLSQQMKPLTPMYYKKNGYTFIQNGVTSYANLL